MCNYVNGNICSISKEICPYVYLCSKTNSYKPSRNMPTDCKVISTIEIPKGYKRVCFERKGNLYIDMGTETIVVPNPFDDIPLFVKVYKNKSGYRLKK